MIGGSGDILLIVLLTAALPLNLAAPLGEQEGGESSKKYAIVETSLKSVFLMNGESNSL